MADVAALEASLAALITARSAGVKRTRGPDGREIEWQSDSAMAAAIADLERRIADARGVRVRTVVFNTSKGI